MSHQGLILTSQRDYAQAMRQGLLGLENILTRVDVELDALRAMQLVPQQYDLILLDALLDSMDGLQLLRLMKQQAPATKFIIVGDAIDETSRAQAYQNGAGFFLERPATPEALRIALADIRALLVGQREGASSSEDDNSPLVRLSDSVQTHCLSGDTVLLLVRGKSQSGDIFIFRGDVFHAQYPGKGGEGAFHDMMHWDGGMIRIKTVKSTHVPPRTIETPYPELLASAEKSGGRSFDLPPTGNLLAVSAETPPAKDAPSFVSEAPPLSETAAVPPPEEPRTPEPAGDGETPLPPVNSHWKVNLVGELVEGSQMAEPARCAFITYFIYRKLADVAVALEVDYFGQLTLMGPHLQQVLVADNLGVRHSVFETAWTTEERRLQYVKWCHEQSF